MIWSQAVGDAKYAAAVRQVLEKNRRVHLDSFLTEDASRALHEAMQRVDWQLVTNVGGARGDRPLADVKQHESAINEAITREAATEFRYIYDGYRLSKMVLAGQSVPAALSDFFFFLNSPEAISFFRAIGDGRIALLDAMATRYRPGHFLTQHNDHEPGSDRLLAYVFNLTPQWRIDWGGWLGFYNKDGHVAEAYVPRWGALNIFKVPTLHAVSQVTSFAGADRYSITGWMRASSAKGS